MFSTELMMKCLKQIFGTIVLHDSSYFIQNSTGMSFCYSVDGKTIYISLPDKLTAAQYLFNNGAIDHFKKEGDEVLIYRKAFYYTSDHRGRPVMVQHYVPLDWNEITFTENDVKLFAARDVWSRVSKGESSYGTTTYNAPISNKKYDA